MYEIRICVTLKCNYLCSYCSRDGEGIYSEKSELTDEELIQIITNMTTIGIDAVRITGGEPFCRNGLLNLANEIRKIPGINKLSIVTNGSLITKDVIEEISNHNPFDYISVSLDTLSFSKYKEITKRDTMEQVINNIVELVKHGVKTRINFVLTQNNVDEVEKIIEFCIQRKIDLKVLDLYNDTENFIDMTVVEQIVKEKGFRFYKEDRIPGGLGTPMKVYSGYGIDVILKDSNEGTTYSLKACEKCSKFPCQLGVVGPIMSHDGIIKICNLGRERGINCFGINELDSIKNILDTAKGISKAWMKNRVNIE